MSQTGALPSVAGLATAPKPLLTIRGVETFYGKIQALKGIDIDVNQGEIVTLTPAGGANTSATLSLGTYPPPVGTVIASVTPSIVIVAWTSAFGSRNENRFSSGDTAVPSPIDVPTDMVVIAESCSRANSSAPAFSS